VISASAVLTLEVHSARNEGMPGDTLQAVFMVFMGQESSNSTFKYEDNEYVIPRFYPGRLYKTPFSNVHSLDKHQYNAGMTEL
jgi:hypothetical protein